VSVESVDWLLAGFCSDQEYAYDGCFTQESRMKLPAPVENA
jgi:hypothetical protein